MAITGNGTQQNPWVVHDYAELKTACESSDPAVHYVELANNINCNDYGVSFVWNTITVGNRYSADWTTHLDLKGHTIQNIQVAADGYMFFCENDAVGSTIENGEILNVFLGGAAGFVKNVDFDKLSISMNATNAKGIFHGVQTVGTPTISNSAIYCESIKLASQSCFIEAYAVSNSDFTTDFADINSNLIFGGLTTFSGCRFKECKVGGVCPNVEIYPYGDMRIFAYGNQFTNCVVDIDFTEITTAPTDDRVFYGFDTATQSTVINKSKWINGGTAPVSWQFCTDEEITSAEYLNEHGFVVVPRSV